MTLVFIVTVCGCISNKENSSQLLTSIVNEYQDHEGYDAVSYTHLTLPTNREV